MNKHMYCHSFPIFGKKELVPTGQTPLPHGGVWDTPIGTKQATAITNKKTKKNSKTCRHLCCSVTQPDVSLVAWERALYGTVLRTAPEIEVSLLFFHLPPHCNWYFSVIIQFWDLTIIVENMIWRDHNFKHGLFSATEVKKIREKYLPRRKLRFSHFPFCHPPPYLIVASWVSPSDLHLLCPSAQPDWPVLQSSSPPLSSSSLGHSLL